MLILRVAKGNAWQTDTMKTPQSLIKFSPGGGATSSSRFNGGGAMVMHLETLSTVDRPESDKHSGEV